jgi:spore photoproduct lyase
MIKTVNRKSMIIRPSGRSSDYITPSFGYGCLFDCTYCYMKRHLTNGLTIANNVEDILTEINSHSMFADVIKPNQTHKKYITYDISCNEDFALHLKYHNWKMIFDFFKENDVAMGTFATKTIPNKLLSYNPNGKIRIRFSLMPQEISNYLEPNTAPIIKRIQAIDQFIEAGYDVHINFSPVINYFGWEKSYAELFKLVDMYVKNKDIVKSEVIFLTHNKDKHRYNEINNLPGEFLLWTPHNQEDKTSEYGGKNIRYKRKLKKKMIDDFIKLHNHYINWNTIRYIF